LLGVVRRRELQQWAARGAIALTLGAFWGANSFALSAPTPTLQAAALPVRLAPPPSLPDIGGVDADSKPARMAALLSSAVEAITTERDALQEMRIRNAPPTDELRRRIMEADDRGAQVLTDLVAEGYRPSQAVQLTLGRLQAPSPNGGVVQPILASAPAVGMYDTAIRDLGGIPPTQSGPASSGPVPSGATPSGATPSERTQPAPGDTQSSGDTASTGDSSGVSMIVIAIAALAVLGMGALLFTRSRRNAELIDAATKDGLTGLFNRRRLDADISGLVDSGSQRVAVLMVDVDHFKHFNDTHGHTAGDVVLRNVGAMLSTSVRSGDVVYRFGGEEFCVLLPGATPAEAIDVAERIRQAAAAIASPGAAVTVSVGGAIGQAQQVRRTIERADQALYRAKRDGRNRISMA
jgi:diguanylate cyclase (GGDEF)-like protein/LPXTG-motif cell wall-anchored protein